MVLAPLPEGRVFPPAGRAVVGRPPRAAVQRVRRGGRGRPADLARAPVPAVSGRRRLGGRGAPSPVRRVFAVGTSTSRGSTGARSRAAVVRPVRAEHVLVPGRDTCCAEPAV